jgi:condensin complex subunit 1
VYSLPTKFPKQRAQITDLTVRTLQDKTSSARRYSIQLLCKLLETHPFGALHGGTLNLNEWQERYDKVAEELAKVDTVEMEKAHQDAGLADEDADEREEDAGKEEEKEEVKDEREDEESEDGPRSPRLKKEKPARKPRISSADLAAVAAEQSTLDPALVTKLRLTKKYYADALRFINQIESAIPTLCQLLVSTTKTEVLEAMRFFRTAYEYDVLSAEKGIKTMLHLIWTKDNNSTSSEEGMDGKGVRASLIEVYRSLYFDVVPDLAPKQQVNRIAKNMIE